MTIGTLYISEQSYRWDSSFVIIDQSNLDAIINSPVTTDCRTSIADIGGENLSKLITSASKIKLVDLFEKYIDLYENTDQCLRYSVGRLFNELIKVKDKVDGIEYLGKLNFKNLEIMRTTDNPTLWVSGCSCSVGIGVENSQSYGHLLSEKLNMPLINLSGNGASIFWAIDRLMRADIKKGDIVILGLSFISRYEYSENWSLKSQPGLHDSLAKFVDVEYLDTSTHILKTSRHVLHLIKFCQQIGARVIIASILEATWLPVIFDNHPDFINLLDDFIDAPKFKDFGSDNLHPGPLQHQEYADKLYDFIRAKN